MINGLWGKLLARLGRKDKGRTRRSPAGAKLIVVVEGRHDVEFLRRISRMLHASDRRLPVRIAHDIFELPVRLMHGLPALAREQTGIREVSGLDLTFDGDDDVADLVARACHDRDGMEPTWDLLPGRAKKRCRERAKRWLNRAAVDQMLPWLLDERDFAGEVRQWMTVAGRFLG